MSEMNIHIDRLAAGQLGAYKDTHYHFILTFTQQWKTSGEWSVWTPPRDKLLEMAQFLVHPFKLKNDPERGWWEPYLEHATETAPGVWDVLVIRTYDD